MGNVYAEITLLNDRELKNVEDGFLPASAVHTLTTEALVDTGATRLVINEDLRQQLNLKIKSERPVTLADGTSYTCKMTEEVLIRWKDRESICRALVLPDAKHILLGAIPLEDMDLMVDPVNQILKGVHGDEIVELAC